MDFQQIVKNNKILEIKSGSSLYGTRTVSSDQDVLGIFMPPKEYVLGLKTAKEIDLSLKKKDEAGKNTSEAIDRKFYEFRKFISLAAQNNPNILEMLFVDSGSIIFVNTVGAELLKMRDAFPSKLGATKLLAYSRSQKHKMIIKKEHYQVLIDALGFLQHFEDKRTLSEVYNESINLDSNSKLFKKKGTHSHIHIGDVCFEPALYVKKVKRELEERIAKATHRTDLILKHGYDTKFASHLIRLLYQALDLLQFNKLIFPLNKRQSVIDIKAGKYKLPEIIEWSEDLELEISKLEKSSSLPTTPNYKEIEKFTIQQMENFLALK